MIGAGDRGTSLRHAKHNFPISAVALAVIVGEVAASHSGPALEDLNIALGMA